MNKETANRICKVCGIVLGLAAVVIGICLMVACAGIYFSGGDDPFSRQSVAEAFATIATPVYLCLTVMIMAVLVQLVLPESSEKRKAEKNLSATLSRLMAKRDLENCDPQLKQQITALEKKRKQDRIIGIVLLVLCSAAFLLYGCNSANFHQSQINASMVKAVVILLVCMAIPFTYALVAAYRARKSLQKQIELVKKIEATAGTPAAASKKACCSPMALRWVILGAAVILLVYGFISGGTADVLTKAVNICTECVGLG